MIQNFREWVASAKLHHNDSQVFDSRTRLKLTDKDIQTGQSLVSLLPSFPNIF